MTLLAGDTGRDADLLRADIFWREQKWADAAKVLGRLARSVKLPTGDGKFSESDSRLVLRLATSLALKGDSAGLKVLFWKGKAENMLKVAYVQA